MVDKESLRKLPKIDLHRHLDGDVKANVVFELAEKEKIDVPAKSPEGLEAYFRKLRDEGIMVLLQKGFGLVTALMQSEENLYKVAFEEVRNIADDGIVYCEVRFAPQYHTGASAYYGHKTRNRLSYHDIIAAVRSGLDAGENAFGVKTNIIICIGREAEPETGVAIARAASLEKKVVAIDLACDEATYPPERHLPAYCETFRTRLKRTVHAGEFGKQPYKNILSAVNELRADRIGHAIPLGNYPDLIELVSAEKIGIEMCPKSNKYCGFINSYGDLKIPQLMSQGVLVSINSDDPAMFGHTLTDTLHELVEGSYLAMKDIVTIQRNAANTAFLPPHERDWLLKKLKII